MKKNNKTSKNQSSLKIKSTTPMNLKIMVRIMKMNGRMMKTYRIISMDSSKKKKRMMVSLSKERPKEPEKIEIVTLSFRMKLD